MGRLRGALGAEQDSQRPAGTCSTRLREAEPQAGPGPRRLGGSGFGSQLPAGPSASGPPACPRSLLAVPREAACVLQGPSSGRRAPAWTGVAQPVPRGSMSRSAGQDRRQLSVPALLPCGRWLWLCSPGETPGPAREVRTPLLPSARPRRRSVPPAAPGSVLGARGGRARAQHLCAGLAARWPCGADTARPDRAGSSAGVGVVGPGLECRRAGLR